MDSPQLSLGFAKGSKTLLICGVLDDAVPVNAAAALRTYGHLGLKAESESIRLGRLGTPWGGLDHV